MSQPRETHRSDDWLVDSNRYRKVPALKLTDGSRVAVIGGGPAGSLFAHFLLSMAKLTDLDLEVDLYEPRDFIDDTRSPCNMCGGIISETLVQNLAADGINLPPGVVQRGIESYVLHINGQRVRINTPVQEKRIASVYRGMGPRNLAPELKTWASFDGHLQKLAIDMGARPVRQKVTAVDWIDGLPQISVKGADPQGYELVAVATGVNSPALKLFQDDPVNYELPKTTKTFIREYHLGEAAIENRLGDAMHVFLLDLPGIEFAAIIPKLNCATVCLLGDDIDKNVFDEFLDSPEVQCCLPPREKLDDMACNCSPHMNVRGAEKPYGDRIVFVGDSGVTRLFKDGIGAAYRTAKAAARTAVFSGVGVEDFERNFMPTCRAIQADNRIGRLVFGITGLIQKRHFARQAVLRMVAAEQSDPNRKLRMSTVMWDMFTGSATYREIFVRTLSPGFLTRFTAANMASILRLPSSPVIAGPLAESDTVGGTIGQG